MCKIKTRLPLTAWVLAGFVTLSSLVSTLMQAYQSDATDATGLVQVSQTDTSCDKKGVIAASVIH